MGMFDFITEPIGGLINSGAQMLFGNQMAKDQRQWAGRMSDTAHQREVSDLKKAGLNPILSAGGRGATTPGGAMAPNVDINRGLGQAASAKALNAQADSVEAIAKINKVDASLAEGMLEYLKKHPEYYETLMTALLGKKAGAVTGFVGAASGAVSSATKEGARKVINVINHYNEWAEEHDYRRMNNEVLKELERKGIRTNRKRIPIVPMPD